MLVLAQVLVYNSKASSCGLDATAHTGAGKDLVSWAPAVREVLKTLYGVQHCFKSLFTKPKTPEWFFIAHYATFRVNARLSVPCLTRGAFCGFNLKHVNEQMNQSTSFSFKTNLYHSMTQRSLQGDSICIMNNQLMQEFQPIQQRCRELHIPASRFPADITRQS